MKLASKKLSLVTRLATLAAVMLFSHQALAVGTPAGTNITNEATVDYEVGSIAQSTITSGAVTFVVDNRVDFTLVSNPDPITATQVMVGINDAEIAFLVQNTGNQTQDYALSVTNTPDSTDDGAGNIDSGDMNNLRVLDDSNNDGCDAADPDFIDELAPDVVPVLVCVWADTDTPNPNQLLDGDFSVLELTAVTHDGGGAGSLGGQTTASATDDPAAEDVVLAVGGVLDDGDNAAYNTYALQSASLTITKTNTLIDDPFNGGADAFYIPGATVEFVITVENTSTTTDALNVSVSDILNNMTLVADAMAGEDVQVVNDGAPVTPCNAEDDTDTDGDGCVFDTATGTLTVDKNLSVAFGTSLVLTFRVTID